MSGDDIVNRVLAAIANEQRRRAISALRQHETLTLADLADELAEREYETTIDNIPPEDVKELYMALYHRHLPKLETVNLVDYEQESDLVAATDRTRSIESTVHCALEQLS